jgi:hypothetical protein
MTAIRILHLYPEELGINGDAGNVLALQRRLEWRAIGAEVIRVGAGGALPEQVDLVHIGSGPRSARDSMLTDVRRHHDRLHLWAESGVPLIAIGAGFHLLARSIMGLDGVVVEALGLFPVTVRDVPRRSVGEVLSKDLGGHRLAGFVNHGVTVNLHDAQPLSVLDRGYANAGVESESRGGAEGVRVGALRATHLHGPILPMNPALADELLVLALQRHDQQLPMPDERTVHADDMARRSRVAIAARLGYANVMV